MLFTGEYEHTIDAKSRILLPAEIRGQHRMEEGFAFYLVPGPNGALWMWPQATFEQMAGAIEQSLVPGDELMEFDELFFSQAVRVEIDKAGRIRVPERLIQQLGLANPVVILGARDHLELRGSAQWRVRLGEKMAKRDEIMLRARRSLAERPRGSRPDDAS